MIHIKINIFDTTNEKNEGFIICDSFDTAIEFLKTKKRVLEELKNNVSKNNNDIKKDNK